MRRRLILVMSLTLSGRSKPGDLCCESVIPVTAEGFKSHLRQRGAERQVGLLK